MKLVFASSNKGKIREIKQLVNESVIQIIPQAEFGITEIEETGQTFVENALLKARQATALTGLPAIADDSGLVVPALNGAPGIFSARYAGKNATNQENIAKLLHNLADQQQKRGAYFYCAIVMLRTEHDPCPLICEGKWNGTILSMPRGEHGFGYDPIFFDAEYQCSAAELPADIKNKISHRGQAMSKLIKSLAIDYSFLFQS